MTTACDGCAALRAELERVVPAFAEQRRARERNDQRRAGCELRDSFATGSELVTAMVSMPAKQRHQVLAVTDRDRALAIARELTTDLRAQFLGWLSADLHAEIAYSIVKPPSRVRVEMRSPNGQPWDVLTNETRLQGADIERARSAGLPLRCDTATRRTFLRGWDLFSSHEAWVFDADAWALRTELCAGTRKLRANGVLQTRPLSDEESRELSLALWRDAGRSRAALPTLP